MKKFEDKLNDGIVEIFEIISDTIPDNYEDVWFQGGITSNGVLGCDFWYLNEDGVVIFLDSLRKNKSISDLEWDQIFSELCDQLESLGKLFKKEFGEPFKNILIHYHISEVDDVSVKMKLAYIDWSDLGFSELDEINYYLAETVGEEYFQGYPEKKDIYLNDVHKMQEYAKTHSK